ncbi:SseB family protein [uncultured Methanobrevibacter sp.]|uniref:SseB family protein n=1 Tax=uncultured Methanobrevibacter sp. TaxID=253161 RepID=UPI002624A0BC|nr:SseB family protein [uncultured Methanobrevibacter sp.]
MTSGVSNNYLGQAIVELKRALENDDNAAEKMTDFILELKVSNLFIPGIDEGEELVYETFIFEEDDLNVLPLFTSEEEFFKHYDDNSEFKPVSNEFEIYAGISDDIDAIVIDPEGESFFVTPEMIEFAAEDFSISYDDIKARSVNEIRQVYDSVSNESLCQFIRDESNDDDLEGLMAELSGSWLINLVVSETSLDEFADDGIIKADDVDGFSLCVMEDDDSGYGIVFTDKDAISKALDEDGLFYYAQLTRLSSLFEFVLRNDMDGVIINPESDDYLIERSAILAQASGIDLVAEDASFKNCLDYAFIL